MRSFSEGLIEGVGPDARAGFNGVTGVVDVGQGQTQTGCGIDDGERFWKGECPGKGIQRAFLSIAVVVAGNAVEGCLEVRESLSNFVDGLEVGFPG